MDKQNGNHFDVKIVHKYNNFFGQRPQNNKLKKKTKEKQNPPQALV